MTTQTLTGTASEVLSQEERLRAEGFQLTAKTREKDLKSHEYFKLMHSGNESSFQGGLSVTITWCRS